MKEPKLQHADRLPAGIQILVLAFLGFASVTMILPMINVLSVSFSEATQSNYPGLILFPRDFTFEGYDFIWNRINLWRPFLITLYVSVAGTFLHILLSSMAGYVLIHKTLPFRHIMTTFIMLTMTVPNELTLVSLYAVNKQLHLINTLKALIINGAASGFSVLLMRNYFSTVPKSLLEAAKLDGASEFLTFIKVYVPLSVSGVITIGTLEFIRRWNNITITVSLISKRSLWTMPVHLREILFEQDSTSGVEFIFANAQMAAVIITAAPLIILYFFTQNFFISGVTLGSVKE